MDYFCHWPASGTVLFLLGLLALSSRTARSEEDRDSLWDAWGPWSDCSRTCGGGASYSLRRCLSSKNCEGRNIRYRTCSNVDCPPALGDFRAQQCSAHIDVRYQGQYYEWLPLYNDPENPCALKCKAKGTSLVVELAPKVLDGTRCYTESLDMCISGTCQIVGCDHELGSTAKEDNCGVCNGDGSTCRLVRGQYKSQLSTSKMEDTVIAIPYGSRHVRLVLKGPDHLHLETKTLQGQEGENSLSTTGSHHIDNTTVDFQKFPDKEILRMSGPLGADFTVKIRYVSASDSIVQFIFYQPIIHRWKETDFFPCSATCGGGYQLTSAECFDLRSGRVVADQYCHYYPENVKPKPKLRECNMDPCPASDGYKEIMPYDLYHPLPRWESSPWTACSKTCGGGIQRRSVSCVEEDIQGNITPVEEWKCMYTPKMPIIQPCNIFDCPKWLAQEWSLCTVTCGQGLRYRVVLCIDHRGLHAGGCNPKTKPHIKEECIVTIPCYKPKEKLPVEAKLPWFKQALELEEGAAVTEEPSFVSDAWSPCSSTCGIGNQRRRVKCQVLLSFSQTVADLPDDECEGPKPPASRPCYSRPCGGEREDHSPEEQDKVLFFQLDDDDELHDWEYEGFTECSESCGGGLQEAVVICLNKQTREVVEESLCVSHRRPPQLLKACSMEPCPPRWETGKWSSCSATCGVGLRTRDVTCTHLLSRESNETVTLSGEKCRPAKPTQVQACNRFDCPSAWYPQDWQQCSRSCGGGVQTREILCKQRLADGSFLELPETFCSPPNPITQQPCENRACPAEWGSLEWSQCSASCGEGTQVLPVVCRKMDENGQYVTLDSSSCSNLLQPSSVRPCSLASCARSLNLGQKLAPHIITLRKVYMQFRKERKLQFVMGGYAYLKPKTSIVLRCPVRRFRKSLINWEKDGMPLTSLPHLTVTPYGYIKIHHLKPSDIGTYTCVAGPMRESFIVKLIGGNHKLIAPPSAAKIKKSKDKPWLISNGRTITESLGNDKTWVFWDHFSQYDNIVLRLLEMKGLARESPDSWELQESSERNISFSEEDHSLEATAPLTMVAEQRRLDEIIKNLSAQPEELRGNYADRLLTQLLAEVTKSQAESNESTMRHHEKDDSTSLESLIHKSNPGTPITPHRDLSSSSESMGHPRQHLRAPSIVTKTHAHLKQHLSSPEVVVHVGHTVLLRSWINLLVVKCEAVGNPEPTISWSKNGEQLKASSRVGMLPDGSLQIFSPSETDVGFYTCTARNSIGATALSSTITLTGKPLIQGSKGEHVILDLSSVSVVDVGGRVKARLGANITLRCQAEGIPKSKISWTVVNGKSVPNHYQSKDGSLLIVNASLLDQGRYTCQAANPYGQVTEVTQLLLLDPPQAFPESEDWAVVTSRAGPGVHSLLVTTTGTRLALSAGSTLLVGCPVKGHPRPHISWFLNSQPLGSAAETTHQLLAEGQVLRLPNVTKHLHGEVRCLSENDAGTLQQRADLDIRDYEWRVDDLMPCSAPCGNKGTQYPRLKCLWDSLEVNRSLCRDKPKPALKPVPCNIKDCLPRWLVTPWSPCSQSCGGGMLSRKVTCNKVTAAGISVTLIEVSCTLAGKRPADMQPCNTLPCVEWATSTWAQCNGQCIGLKQATQHRQVFCQAKNGTVMTFNQCSSVPRPPSTRSCTSETCNVQWHVGSWTQCTATCGNYGFQSRRVECVHLRSGKAGREQFCSWRQRPANWQRCNILPCEKLECRDTTRHCEKVKQLKLCQLSQFKVRCCESCKDT
ncbi:ADAMTS-like protein 1 [Huso huso]|uniref:ADAMTS-like protein 1 n=1 Tax=Huso huso TaxID=61971 RepID=A0ABR1A7Z6_HUSHU